jgi:hypothetical protein
VTSTPYADYYYLREHAQRLFPGASIGVTHTDDEVIHIDVNGHRYTFEITSDDEEYVFTDGRTTFRIPVMESPDEF